MGTGWAVPGRQRRGSTDTETSHLQRTDALGSYPEWERVGCEVAGPPVGTALPGSELGGGGAAMGGQKQLGQGVGG